MECRQIRRAANVEPRAAQRQLGTSVVAFERCRFAAADAARGWVRFSDTAGLRRDGFGGSRQRDVEKGLPDPGASLDWHHLRPLTDEADAPQKAGLGRWHIGKCEVLYDQAADRLVAWTRP